MEHRIYTDRRVPGLEVRNEGGPSFFVVDAGGRVLEEFDGYEDPDREMVSEAFAQRRAVAFFEREVKNNDRLIAEAAEDLRRLRASEPTDVVDNQGRDFSDEQVVTPDGMLDMWEKAQAMPPGPEKEAAIAQVRTMASQMESAADEIVRRLLD